MSLPPAAFLLALLAALPLAGCGPQAGRCAGPERRELATVERLIEETQENLRRGYTLAPAARDPALRFCVGTAQTNVGLSLCSDTRTRGRPVAIDRAAEARKLAALEARREALRAAIAAQQAQCGRGEAAG